MALSETLRELAQQLLTPGGTFEDIPREIQYLSTVEESASTYNPTTGVYTANEETAVTLSGAVETDPTYRQVDNVHVFPKDKFFLISGLTFDQAFLASGLTIPRESKPGDRILDGTKSWNVISIRSDPVDAVRIIHVRQP